MTARRALPVDARYPVSSGFRPPDRPGHTGADWAAPLGAALYAPADSVIVQGLDRAEGSVSGYSNWVWGRTADGFDWCLGHMPHASIRVVVGDRVAAGQQVATVGGEGDCVPPGAPHAHLSVYAGPLTSNRAIDPLKWINENQGGTIMLGLDYSGGRPSGRAIKDAGYAFVVRYLSDGGPGLPGKLLTPQEADDLRANGIGIAVVWETTAARMLGGYDAGATDARLAQAQISRCAGPADRPIYFAADWDATPQQQDEINDYLRGAASVIGVDRVGMYGGFWPLSRAKDAGLAKWFWQTEAWSGSNRLGGRQLHQRIGFVNVAGVQCDVNEALVEDFGQWGASEQKPPVTTAPESGERPDYERLTWEQLAGPGGGGWAQLDNKYLVDFIAAFRDEQRRANKTVGDALALLLKGTQK